MEMIDLQNKFATRIANSMKSAWDEIWIHYENAIVEGEAREVFSASFVSNGVKNSFNLPLDAVDILVDLKRCKPENQADEWLWLEFFIDKTGKYKFDYKYEDPPLIMREIKYSK